MTSHIEIDFETRSDQDVSKVGAYRYFTSPYTQVMMASFEVNSDGGIHRWRRGSPPPPLFVQAVEEDWTIYAHNAGFERLAIMLNLSKLPGRLAWPRPRLEQFKDTAAMAAVMSMPRALSKLCSSLNLPAEKDDEGNRLMKKLAKPRKIWLPSESDHKRYPKGAALVDDQFYEVMDDGRVIEWWADDKDLDREHLYCDRDVVAQRTARQAMFDLLPSEWEAYWLTERMNDRGVPLDMKLVRALQRIADTALHDLDREMSEATGGVVDKCSKVAAIREYLKAESGFKLPDLAADTVDKQLDRADLPNSVRVILELRQQAAKASTAKLKKIEQCQINGRVHGVHLYHGAGTGRWSGRLLQTQNMPRGTGVIKDVEKVYDDLVSAQADLIRTKYGNPLFAVSDSLRGCIAAPEGHELYVADYSSIEGRVTAWVAGEDWKLDVFRKADKGEGPGAYEIAAAGIYNVPAESIGDKDPKRQVGKVSELALGFQGGVRAYHSMAKVYRVDMAEAYEPIVATTDSELVAKATKLQAQLSEQYQERLYDALRKGDDQDAALALAEGLDDKEADKLAGGQARGVNLMSPKAWIASEITKVKWRNQHPATVDLWFGLEAAAVDAVLNPGSESAYRQIRYKMARGFLWCRLPSGRALMYGAPRLKKQPKPWNPEEWSWSVTAMTLDSTSGRWVRRALYGGLLTENVVQAVARDLMLHGLVQTEKAGFQNIMTVHDEGVALVPKGANRIEEYCALLADLPEWAAGIPVVTKRYVAGRYKKD